MERLHKEFEIGVPLRAAYNQWTQFEEFPRFMEGVKEVRQLDDTHLHWRASIGGKEKEWEAEITEQVPDRIIAWRSISGTPNSGRVTFEPAGADRTRVRLELEYVPQTAVEKAGDALGVVSRRIDRTVEDFKQYIERQGGATGAWRGEVHGGEPRLQVVAPTPGVGAGLGGAAAAHAQRPAGWPAALSAARRARTDPPRRSRSR